MTEKYQHVQTDEKSDVDGARLDCIFNIRWKREGYLVEKGSGHLERLQPVNVLM